LRIALSALAPQPLAGAQMHALHHGFLAFLPSDAARNKSPRKKELPNVSARVHAALTRLPQELAPRAAPTLHSPRTLAPKRQRVELTSSTKVANTTFDSSFG